ncbi:hypothetical protein QBC38DRAFT_399763 [Podospora fimiseda]|uniref:Apple domain-containing protein n=1 Tax=Podospora fimiseda TaxID=252190 RepID=A0AAN7BHK9_9PEZI|nr:hypothetical protein QBC38DRAFT_399763 [Podospora fimiseda]
MEIHQQNEGKIYMPTPPYQNDGKIYVPQSSTSGTPSWGMTPQQHPAELAQYGPLRPYTAPPHPPEEERTICGLRKITFLLSVIIAILVLALALGLGLGLGLKDKDQTGDASPANQTNGAQIAGGSTTTQPPTATTPGSSGLDKLDPSVTIVTVSQTVTALPTILPLDCPNPSNPSPSIKMEAVKGTPSFTFLMNCGKDNSGFDIMNTMAYSFDDCMRACIMYNVFSRPLKCTSVQFWKPIANAKRTWDGNCFLKNGTVAKVENKDATQTVWAELVE